MSRKGGKHEDGLVCEARRRIDYYRHEVEQEPWKQQHQKALRCYAIEDAIRQGVALFDGLVRLDEALRAEMYSRTERTEQDKRVLQLLRALFTLWLEPCAKVEAELSKLEADFGTIEFAGEFRKRYAEAKWMIAPGKDVFAHEAFVAARDAAIEAFESGDVEEFQPPNRSDAAG